MAVNVEEMEDLFYEPFRRLTQDQRRAAETMSDAEVRYLIDLYYNVQESRKRSQNQVRASSADGEPNSLTQFLAAQVEALEGACNGALQVIARRTRSGRWCMGIKGISGVLTAGLLASLDVTHAPTASSYWRFSGLDPTFEWLGKERAGKLYAELRETVPGARTARDLVDSAARRTAMRRDGLLARVERQTRPRTARAPVRTLEEVFDHLTRTQLINALATRPWKAGLKTLCVLPDQRVTTRRGHIPISEIVVGDEVLTHVGRWQKVEHVYINQHDGPVRQLQAWGRGNQGPWLTHGHPVYQRRRHVIRWTNKHGQKFVTKRKNATFEKTYARAVRMRAMHAEGMTMTAIAQVLGVSIACVSNNIRGRVNRTNPVTVGWEPVEAIETGHDIFAPVVPADTRPLTLDLSQAPGMVRRGDMLLAEGQWAGIPAPRARPVPAVLPLNAPLARLIGLYLAEGHTTGNYVGWSFHLKEESLHAFVTDMLEGVFGLASHITYRTEANSAQVMVGSKLLASVFSEIFGKGAHEKTFPVAWIEQLGIEEAHALMAGLFEGDGTVHADGSRTLTTVSTALAYRTYELLRRLHHLASIHYSGGVYKVRILAGTRMAEWTPVGSWHPCVRHPEKHYTGLVYNLEVAQDHSYVVEGLAVHNCWKLFDCLVKVQNRDDAPYYCVIYQNRKRREWERNFLGEYHEQCTAALSRNLTALQRPWYSGQYDPAALRPQWTSGANPSTWKLPEPVEGGVPMLPPGRIELRARRIGVKQFLADLHYCMHEEHFGVPPTPNAEQQARGKTAFRPPPGWPETV